MSSNVAVYSERASIIEPVKENFACKTVGAGDGLETVSGTEAIGLACWLDDGLGNTGTAGLHPVRPTTTTIDASMALEDFELVMTLFIAQYGLPRASGGGYARPRPSVSA